MYEIDAASGRSAAGSIIKQAYAPVTQLRGYGFDIGNPVCQLLDSLSVAVKEFGDRRIRRERCQQLNAGVGVADRQHCFADSLVFVDFLVHAVQVEGARVELKRLVQIGDGDTDVIDCLQEMMHEFQPTADSPQ